MMNAPSRKYRSSRNVPASTARPQVTVRRGDDASVYLDAALGAHSADFSFLQSSEQLRLDRRSNLADLVQENRAAAGDFEEARLVSNGAGKCASHMAEQFRFEQRFRERRAIDAHEWRGALADSDRGSGGR